MPDDNELQERFAELRRQDRSQAGDYSAFLRRARPHATRPYETGTRLFVWGAVGASLALVTVIVVMSIERPRRGRPGNPEISITEWKSSTDFLLRTPGEELLQSVPKIGEWPASTKTRGGSRRPPRIKKSLLQPLSQGERS